VTAGLVESLTARLGRLAEAQRIAEFLRDVAEIKWWCGKEQMFAEGEGVTGETCMVGRKHKIETNGCGVRWIITP